MKTNWLPNLGNSPEDYMVKMELLVVISLLQKHILDLDFTAIEMLKRTATMAEMVDLFETALQSSPLMKM